MGGGGNDHGGGEEDRRWSCCNDNQTLFVLLYLAFIILAILTWNTLIAKPMRLVAVFVHEWSHAIACWLTGGKVHNIEVYHNEGGVTRYAGGCRMLIIPAGYVGCSFWAMIFVILSGGRRTATVAAVAFSVSLLLTLCYSPNRILVQLCVCYALLTVAAIVIEWRYYSPVLQFLILFYGVFVGVFSISDIYEATVLREIKGSDAYACSAEVWPCCAPRCIGFQWAILAVAFQFIGIWIALVQMSEECEDLGWFECMNLSIDGWSMDDLFGRHWEWGGWWEQHGWNNGP